MTTADAGRVVIVGASLAGATAAFSLRENGFDGDIVLVGAETVLPYERPALSKNYLAGDVELDKLLVRPAEDYDTHRVELRLGQTAIALDADRRLVTLAEGEQLAYDHLVVAVIVGMGFIGCEIAAVELADGRCLPAELVVVGVGVRPATGWLLDAPLHLVRGALGVDAEGHTNLPGAYAAGDVTATWDVRQEHWAYAINQGPRVARALAGAPQAPPVVPSFWSDQFDRRLQYAGHHDGDCDPVVRGDLGEPDAPLVAFFLHAGTLAAVLTVNSGKELRRAQRLIGHPVDPPRRWPTRASTCVRSRRWPPSPPDRPQREKAR